jgi:hypothetical protein
MLSLLVIEIHIAAKGVENHSTAPTIPSYLSPYTRPRKTPGDVVVATPSNSSITAIRSPAPASQ